MYIEWSTFSAVNKARCESPDGFNLLLSDWSLSDWATAVCGELGEAANVITKLNRIRDNIPGNVETEAELRSQLAEELADTFIYLDLLSQASGVCLDSAVCQKFNATSQKIGWSE